MGAAEALGGLRQNKLGGPVGIGDNVRIPQSDDAPTLSLEICRPLRIGARGVDMLTAVELYSEPSLTTREIDDEGSDDKLSRKCGAVVGKTMPHSQFGRRWVVAQLAGTPGQFRIDATSHATSVGWLATLANPPLAPPFQGGECLYGYVAVSGTSGIRIHSFSSPGTLPKRPAFQSALAWSIRSLRELTKFHHT